MENQTTNVSPQDNGKTVAIVSYLTFIGWIVAFVLNNGNKTSIGSYHIRQSLMLFICSFALGIINFITGFIPVIGRIVSFACIIAYVALFVFWIIGFINAVNGQEKPIPVIGDKANEMLKGVA